MKNAVSLIVLCLIHFQSLFAQEDVQKKLAKPEKPAEKDGWVKKGVFALNVNQGALSNWAAGGEQNTLGFNTLLNYQANLRKGKNTWDNYFDVALGFQNATSFNQFRKNDDRIDITTKYGRQVSKNWYTAFLVNLNTQMLAGYNYTDTTNTKISSFLSPGKILISLGMDFKPNNDFSLFISPLTARWVIKADKDFLNINKFGVDSSKKSLAEFGAYVSLKYKKPITKWATYTGRLDLFSNYKKNPQNVDALFNNLLSMKFNEWLGANISLDILYDDDILKKTQLKEIMGLGLTLKL